MKIKQLSDGNSVVKPLKINSHHHPKEGRVKREHHSLIFKDPF